MEEETYRAQAYAPLRRRHSWSIPTVKLLGSRFRGNDRFVLWESCGAHLLLLLPQIHQHGFAVVECEREFAVAECERVVAEHFGAPSMQRRHVVFMRGEFLDVFAVGDEPRRHARRFRAVAQQRL